MPAKLSLKDEVLAVLNLSPNGLSRDELYACGRLSAHSAGQLLIALNELVDGGLVYLADPTAINEPYRLSALGKRAAQHLEAAARRLRPVSSRTVTDQARELVHGERQQAYGHPLDFCQRVADLWNAMPPQRFTPERVGLFMALFKVAREDFAHKEDNLVDLAGYAEVVDLIHKERAARAASLESAFAAA